MNTFFAANRLNNQEPNMFTLSSTPAAGARNQQLYLVAGFSPVPLVEINEALEFARLGNRVYDAATREEVTIADLEMASKGKDANGGEGNSDSGNVDGGDPRMEKTATPGLWLPEQ